MRFAKSALIMTLIAVVLTLSIVSVIPTAAKTVDIDGDNIIGINDATEIQKFLAGLTEPSDNFYEDADADEDGKVSIDDATYIQKYISGLLDEPVPEPTNEVTSEPSTEPTTESVTEVIYPTSLSINKSSITLGISEEFALIATCDAEDYKCAFSSENSSVAEVTDEGVISAVSEGTAKKVCSTENGLTAFCEVTVKPLTTSLSLNKTSLTLGIGEQFDLDSSIESGTAAYHRYFYSNKSEVASVEKAGGLVTAKAVGKSEISCVMSNGMTAKCVITVKPMATTISLNKTSLTLGIGEQFDLDSSIESGTAAYHRYFYSDKPEVASVEKAG